MGDGTGNSSQVSSADAGQFHRVKPAAREGGSGDDGQDRGKLSPTSATDAARHAVEIAEDRNRSWSGGERPGAGSGRQRILYLRKLGCRTAQNCFAPRIMWAMQSGQRAS